MEIPRLNGVIKVLEEGKPAFTCFTGVDTDSAGGMANSRYDGVVFELEHNPWDIGGLKDAMQYMLNRRQILESGTLAPKVTPIVRIPPNGGEHNQFFAKQALDIGAYGVVWPHISTVDQAYNAVAACRYPRLPDKPRYEPQGLRGDGPTTAARFWGLTQQEYYQKADVWPLDPNGEILVILMIEDTVGIKNLDEILSSVPGVGAVLIGEGDLSQELGVPRHYEHPTVLEHIAQVVATCKRHDVPVGHPHVDANNVERLLGEGFRFLMAGAGRNYGSLNKGLQLAGRE